MSLVSTLEQLDFEKNFESPAWRNVAVTICDHEGVEFASLERAPSSDHIVYLADDRYVVKIFRPMRNCFARESKALEFASGLSAFRTPEIEKLGNFEGLDHMITTQVRGGLTPGPSSKLPQSSHILANSPMG